MSKELIFPFLCIFGKSVVCCCTSQKHLLFHLYHSPSGCPSDHLYTSPHHQCVSMCAVHAEVAHHHPFPLLYLLGEVKLEHSLSTNIAGLSFRCDTETSPFMTAKLTPHRSADFLCNCLVLRAGKQIVHSESVHPHIPGSLSDHRQLNR